MTIENKNIEDFIIYCELIMDNFKEVDYKLKSGIVTEYSNFQKHFYSSSRYHAPGKKKIVPFNNALFIKKVYYAQI